MSYIDLVLKIYSYRERLDCQSWIDLNKRTITSPHHPFEYGNRINCAWLLMAPVRHNVWLRVVDMEVNISLVLDVI